MSPFLSAHGLQLDQNIPGAVIDIDISGRIQHHLWEDEFASQLQLNGFVLKKIDFCILIPANYYPIIIALCY